MSGKGDMTRQERKAKKEKKKREKEELDTETTVADMNVEGFSWYDPNKKKKNAGQPVKLTRKEYWAMVRGAFAAMFPMIWCILAGAALVFLLAYMWLK